MKQIEDTLNDKIRELEAEKILLYQIKDFIKTSQTNLRPYTESRGININRFRNKLCWLERSLGRHQIQEAKRKQLELDLINQAL